MAQASPSKLMEETTLKENKLRTQEPHGICFLAEVERQKVTEVSESAVVEVMHLVPARTSWCKQCGPHKKCRI